MTTRGWKVFIIYIYGVLAGAVVHCMASTNPMQGASGGAFALATAHIGTTVLNWKESSHVRFRNGVEHFPWIRWLRLILAILCMGFSAVPLLFVHHLLPYYLPLETCPGLVNRLLCDVDTMARVNVHYKDGISHYAHLGGSLVGGLLSIVYSENKKTEKWEILVQGLLFYLCNLPVLITWMYIQFSPEAVDCSSEKVLHKWVQCTGHTFLEKILPDNDL